MLTAQTRLQLHSNLASHKLASHSTDQVSATRKLSITQTRFPQHRPGFSFTQLSITQTCFSQHMLTLKLLFLPRRPTRKITAEHSSPTCSTESTRFDDCTPTPANRFRRHDSPVSLTSHRSLVNAAKKACMDQQGVYFILVTCGECMGWGRRQGGLVAAVSSGS